MADHRSIDERIDDEARNLVDWIEVQDEWKADNARRQRALRRARKDNLAKVFAQPYDVIDGLPDTPSRVRFALRRRLTEFAYFLTRELKATKERRKPGRPSTRRVLIKLIHELVTTHRWSARKAASYVAARVGRVWSKFDSPLVLKVSGIPTKYGLSEQQVWELWGGWWATDDKERQTRQKRLSEQLRIAYVSYVDKSRKRHRPPRL